MWNWLMRPAEDLAILHYSLLLTTQGVTFRMAFSMLFVAYSSVVNHLWLPSSIYFSEILGHFSSLLKRHHVLWQILYLSDLNGKLIR